MNQETKINGRDVNESALEEATDAQLAVVRGGVVTGRIGQGLEPRPPTSSANPFASLFGGSKRFSWSFLA